MPKLERSFARQFKQKTNNNISYDYSTLTTTDLKEMRRNNKNDKEMVRMINRELIFRKEMK